MNSDFTRVVVYTDLRFARRVDGLVVSATTMGYDFFSRYKGIASEVVVVGRVDGLVSDGVELTGAGVSLRAIDCGANRLVPSALMALVRSVKDAISPGTVTLLRLPSPFAGLVGLLHLVLRRNYAVELVGDPAESLASIGPKIFGKSIAAVIVERITRLVVKHSDATSYVTREALQSDYPTGAGIRANYSSIDLPSRRIAEDARTFAKRERVRVLSVGTMERMYKRFDLVMEACAEVGSDSIALRLVGDGRYRRELEDQALRLGLDVQFVGLVPQNEVWEHYDWADVFVLMSDTEGLPRVVIEAQARGVPTIATDVGGVAEAVGEALLIGKGSYETAAGHIRRLSSDEDFYRRQSQEAIGRAKYYSNEPLQARRRRFYGSIAQNLGGGHVESDD